MLTTCFCDDWVLMTVVRKLWNMCQCHLHGEPKLPWQPHRLERWRIKYSSAGYPKTRTCYTLQERKRVHIVRPWQAFTYLTWDSITGVTWDVGGIIQTSLATSNRCWEILSISAVCAIWPLCQDLFSWQTSVNHLVNIAWEKIKLQDCNMVKITFLFP